MIKYFCDKCEQEVSSTQSLINITFPAYFEKEGSFSSSYICRDCTKKVHDFIRNRKD